MTNLYLQLKNLLHDERAQDLTEYALLTGFIAVAAGASIPDVANSISTIFSKMSSVTVVAGNQ